MNDIWSLLPQPIQQQVWPATFSNADIEVHCVSNYDGLERQYQLIATVNGQDALGSWWAREEFSEAQLHEVFLRAVQLKRGSRM